MASPTREDAQLLIQLAQWGTALGVWEAMPELFAEDFDSDVADANDDDAVRTMLMFGETIGTLTKQGLLSQELINEWLWVEGIWERVGPAAARALQRAAVVRELRGACQRVSRPLARLLFVVEANM
jgi:hypothetical protein